MKIKKLIPAVFLFSQAAMLQAQMQPSRQEFSLEEAQQYALNNNAAMKNARLDVKSAKERVWETTATGLPQVQAGVDYTDNLQLMTTLIPAEFFQGEPGTFQAVQFGTQHNATASVTATQLIFSGPYIVGLQAASTYRELSQESLIKSTADVKEAVAKSYYSIILAETGRDATQRNLDNMRQRLEETRAMYRQGFVDETDVDQLRISVSNLENALKTAQQSVDLSYKFLLYQMGYDLDRDIVITDSLDRIMSDVTLQVLSEEFTPEDHIDFRLMETQEQLAYLQMKRSKFEYMPTVSANLTHRQMAMRSEFNFFDSGEDWYPATMLGVSISVPILSSGMRKAKVGQDRIEFEKAKNTKDETARGLELQVRQARIDFSGAYEKYLNGKKSLELAQKVFDNTSIKFSRGLAGSFDLSQASDQLIAVQSSYISSMVELLNARLSLKKALGDL